MRKKTLNFLINISSNFHVRSFIILIYQDLVSLSALQVMRVLGVVLSKLGYPRFPKGRWIRRRGSVVKATDKKSSPLECTVLNPLDVSCFKFYFPTEEKKT